jgi:hypothetical protein
MQGSRETAHELTYWLNAVWQPAVLGHCMAVHVQEPKHFTVISLCRLSLEARSLQPLIFIQMAA